MLDNIALDIANNYILPQFNKPIKNDLNVETHFKHIDRGISSGKKILSDIIYKPNHTAWNICHGFGGTGITFNFKDAYNYTINKIKSESDNNEILKYLYVNFQEIDGKNCLESLIKYHWNYNEFTMDNIDLPNNVSEYDILRKALLIAIRKQYISNGQKDPIILVMDGSEKLIFNDPEFKFWIMFLGGAVQQQMISIVSVLPHDESIRTYGSILQSTYGNISNVLKDNKGEILQIINFFSEKEIIEILKLNLILESDMENVNYKLLGNKLYEITKGYPVLLSDIIIGINNGELLINNVLNYGYLYMILLILDLVLWVCVVCVIMVCLILLVFMFRRRGSSGR
eukprot:253857_1